MYEVTIEHPGIEPRRFTCKDGGELRTLVYGVHRAQGQLVADDQQTIAAVGAVRSQADIEGESTLNVLAATITVEPADESAYACDGHEDLYAGLGETVTCDGACKPRRRFNQQALVDLSIALDDAELDADGGCGRCGLEGDQMCVACGKCNCERHDRCVRPAAGAE